MIHLSACLILLAFATSLLSQVHRESFEPKSNQDSQHLHRKSYGSTLPKGQIYINFINKSGRRVKVYQSVFYGYEVAYRFQLRPNEPRMIGFYPDESTWTSHDLVTDNLMILNGRPDFRTHFNDVDRVFEVKIESPPYLSPEIPDIPTHDTFYIETILVADQSMVNYHGDQHLLSYCMTMMNTVARAFSTETLGLSMEITLVDFLVWTQNPSSFAVRENEPSLSIVSGCKSAREMSKRNSDLVIILTREALGPAGYSAMYTMCTSRACAIVQDRGLGSAYVIAHEIGHTLGIDHDNDSGCAFHDYDGSIMSHSVYSTHANFHWSSCSRVMLLQNINYMKCLENKPRGIYPAFAESIKHLPGELLDNNRQCALYSTRNSTSCSLTTVGLCKYLWCRSGGATNQQCRPLFLRPPLEGSTCGHRKICLRGNCVRNKKPEPIDGSWATWSAFSHDCSDYVSLVQRRNRTCDNPTPKHGGRFCTGPRFQIKLCPAKEVSKFNFEFAAKMTCNSSKELSRTWMYYDTLALENEVEKANLTCNFEHGMCGWITSPSSKKDWLLWSGATPSASTGPSFDNTFMNTSGKYIYFEASWTDRRVYMAEGDRNILDSQRTVLVPEACLKFAYHMYGRSIRSLEVKIRTTNETKAVWKEFGNKGDTWHFGKVTIRSEVAYTISFEVVRGEHFDCDYALDDISFLPGSCDQTMAVPESDWSCAVRCIDTESSFLVKHFLEDGSPCRGEEDSNFCFDKHCAYSVNRHYNFVALKRCRNLYKGGKAWEVFFGDHAEKQAKQSELSCNFERDFCGWNSNPAGSIKPWIRQSGPTPSQQTGPRFDHTYQDQHGKYVYFEGSFESGDPKYAPGQVSALESKSTLLLPEACLTFAYHMFGRSIVSLRVRVSGISNKAATIWEKIGNQGDRWFIANLTISSRHAYKIRFEVVRGSHFDCDYAIDDIEFRSGACEGGQANEKPCSVLCKDEAGLELSEEYVEDGSRCRNGHLNEFCLHQECHIVDDNGVFQTWPQ